MRWLLLLKWTNGLRESLIYHARHVGFYFGSNDRKTYFFLLAVRRSCRGGGGVTRRVCHIADWWNLSHAFPCQLWMSATVYCKKLNVEEVKRQPNTLSRRSVNLHTMDGRAGTPFDVTGTKLLQPVGQCLGLTLEQVRRAFNASQVVQRGFVSASSRGTQDEMNISNAWFDSV